MDSGADGMLFAKFLRERLRHGEYFTWEYTGIEFVRKRKFIPNPTSRNRPQPRPSLRGNGIPPRASAT